MCGVAKWLRYQLRGSFWSEDGDGTKITSLVSACRRRRWPSVFTWALSFSRVLSRPEWASSSWVADIYAIGVTDDYSMEACIEPGSSIYTRRITGTDPSRAATQSPGKLRFEVPRSTSRRGGSSFDLDRVFILMGTGMCHGSDPLASPGERPV